MSQELSSSSPEHLADSLPPYVRIESGKPIYTPANTQDLNKLEAKIVEDLLPAQGSPDMLRGWEAREQLSEVIRPKNFLGSLMNIRVAFLDEPFAQLQKYSPRYNNLKPTSTVWAQTHTLGFVALYDLHATGRGIIKPNVFSRVWVRQLDPRLSPASRGSNALGEYKRVCETPGQIEAVEQLNQAAKENPYAMGPLNRVAAAH